jgi:hypothetical protein
LTTEPQPTSPGFRLLKENRLRLLTDGAGAIEPDQRGYGLYAGDTRFICRLGLFGRLSLKRPGLPTAVGTMRISGLLVGSSQVDLEIRRTRRGFRVRTLGPDGPIRVTPSR